MNIDSKNANWRTDKDTCYNQVLRIYTNDEYGRYLIYFLLLVWRLLEIHTNYSLFALSIKYYFVLHLIYFDHQAPNLIIHVLSSFGYKLIHILQPLLLWYLSFKFLSLWASSAPFSYSGFFEIFALRIKYLISCRCFLFFLISVFFSLNIFFYSSFTVLAFNFRLSFFVYLSPLYFSVYISSSSFCSPLYVTPSFSLSVLFSFLPSLLFSPSSFLYSSFFASLQTMKIEASMRWDCIYESQRFERTLKRNLGLSGCMPHI